MFAEDSPVPRAFLLEAPLDLNFGREIFVHRQLTGVLDQLIFLREVLSQF